MQLLFFSPNSIYISNTSFHRPYIFPQKFVIYNMAAELSLLLFHPSRPCEEKSQRRILAIILGLTRLQFSIQ